ncbi:MAG: tetratricopeptide repeat protein [Gammaproteobacteria bacterium]|nr:tetratricopeptide repeat protein [Gammaproteobacteria bacterium]
MMSIEQVLRSGFVYSGQGRFDDAIRAFKEVIAAAPNQPEAHLGLGNAYLTQGRLEDAVGCYQRAVAIRPDWAMAHYNLGAVRFNQKRLDDAAASYERALALEPDSHQTCGSLAFTYLAQGKLTEAIATYQRLVVLKPDDPTVRHHLGDAFFRAGRTEEAIVSYRDALRINSKYSEAQLALGLAYYRSGQLRQAVVSWENAAALKPGYAEAYNNLGTAYLDQGHLEKAAANFEKTIALRPESAVPVCNLGLVRFKQGRFDEAVACYRKSIGLKPDYAEALFNLGVALTSQGRIEEAIVCYGQGLQIDPDSPIGLSARASALNRLAAVAPNEAFAAHRAFAERCEAPLKRNRRGHSNTREPDRRLRVGYVSPDFRHHSVAYFIAPVFEHHDRSRIEVFGYYNSLEHDDRTDWLSAKTDHWRVCASWSDEQLAERIRADGIDVLVDLAGHTNGNRLLTFARKPAPVQVTYLGYPGTTGLDAIDYRLCTWDTDPEGAEAWHSEQLYRLPRTLWCYRPALDRPEKDSPGSQISGVTFGSMNGYPKISPEIFSLWMEILRAVPRSRLIMTSVPSGSVHQALNDQVQRHGVDPQRIIAHARLSDPEYQQLLRQIDIALDPYPYNGTTTTCETLWSGVPVVSLSGDRSVSRSGYALLKQLGLEALVARSEAEYVSIAVELASDRARLARLRTDLPERFERSPLRDEAGFIGELEAAYREMWRSWCSTGLAG